MVTLGCVAFFGIALSSVLFLAARSVSGSVALVAASSSALSLAIVSSEVSKAENMLVWLVGLLWLAAIVLGMVEPNVKLA